MDVGVRELKQHLSAYLERAARGEVIRVTERGRPKAILGPVPGRDRLDEGVADGWVTPATSVGLAPVPRAPGRGPVLDSLGEDRDG